jgi:hypothetical protein
MARRRAIATIVLAAVAIAITPAAESTAQQAVAGCGPRVLIEYTDDDPDYFIIKNRSPEGWFLSRLAIDLSQAATSLVFDPDDGGPGVGGAAPFSVYDETTVRLKGTIPADDGGRTIGLVFENFAPGEDFTFHIDLDAFSGEGGRTWVLPSDIAGAQLTASFTGPSGQSETMDARFDKMAEADSGTGGCV